MRIISFAILVSPYILYGFLALSKPYGESFFIRLSVRIIPAHRKTGAHTRPVPHMAQRSTQRTDTSLSRPIFGHTPRKLPRLKTSNLPVHRNLPAFGRDKPNRGLAHRNKKGCICQYNFLFFSENFFASQDVPENARFRTRYSLSSPAPRTYLAAFSI